MKYELPSPITDENFNHAWEYANEKLVEIKKKKLIRKVLVLVANPLFFLCISLVTLNIIFRLPIDGISILIDIFKPLAAIAFMADPIIYHPDLHIAVQILIYLAFIFVPTLLGSSIAALIVWFTYHPAKALTETGDKSVDSKTLTDALFESEYREKKVGGISSIIGLGLYLLGILSLPTTLLFHITIHPEACGDTIAAYQLMQYLSTFFQAAAPIVLLVIYGVYAGLNECVSSILKPFYRTKISPKLQEDAKAYYYECNPEIKAAIEEEDRILERAIEIKLKRRQEEADLIAKITYQKPIYKYIKMGIVALLLIVALVFTSSKLKSVDIDKLFNELGIESVEPDTESTETEISTEVTNE